MTNKRVELKRQFRATNSITKDRSGMSTIATMQDQTDVNTPRMNDYPHIIDDGDVKDHGYFLPKQQLEKQGSVGNSGIGSVEVPIAKLRTALADTCAEQRKRLAEG